MIRSPVIYFNIKILAEGEVKLRIQSRRLHTDILQIISITKPNSLRAAIIYIFLKLKTLYQSIVHLGVRTVSIREM